MNIKNETLLKDCTEDIHEFKICLAGQFNLKHLNIKILNFVSCVCYWNPHKQFLYQKVSIWLPITVWHLFVALDLKLLATLDWKQTFKWFTFQWWMFGKLFLCRLHNSHSPVWLFWSIETIFTNLNWIMYPEHAVFSETDIFTTIFAFSKDVIDNNGEIIPSN